MEAYLEADLHHAAIRQAPAGRYAMYGGLTPLPDGELLCVYKTGSLDPKTGSPWTVRDETIVWTRTRDGAWPDEERVIYADPATRQENCCGRGCLTGDGRWLHPFYVLNADYEECAQAQNWARLHLAETPDRGQTWAVRRLDVPLALAASFGGFLRLADGTLLLNVYGAAAHGTFRHQSGTLRSSDEGRTWGDYRVIGAGAEPDGGPALLNETGLVELPSGRLLSMSRTQYDGFPLVRGRAADAGGAWQVERSGLTGLCPALCVSRAGPPAGTVVLVYHDRWGRHADRGGVYATFSTDEGTTWGEPQWLSAGAYPCLLETAPGRMLCTYYRDNTLLRGTSFHVPFPSGLRSLAGTPAEDTGAVCLEWDAYRGRQASTIESRVHRAESAEFAPRAANCVGEVCGGNRFVDCGARPGLGAFYRIVAWAAGRELGRSWLAAGGPVATAAGREG